MTIWMPIETVATASFRQYLGSKKDINERIRNN